MNTKWKITKALASPKLEPNPISLNDLQKEHSVQTEEKMEKYCNNMSINFSI